MSTTITDFNIHNLLSIKPPQILSKPLGNFRVTKSGILSKKSSQPSVHVSNIVNTRSHILRRSSFSKGLNSGLVRSFSETNELDIEKPIRSLSLNTSDAVKQVNFVPVLKTEHQIKTKGILQNKYCLSIEDKPKRDDIYRKIMKRFTSSSKIQNTNNQRFVNINSIKTPKKLKSVTFSQNIAVEETFSKCDYERKIDLSATSKPLSKKDLKQIKKEINLFKKTEMIVHKLSKKHTHYL